MSMSKTSIPPFPKKWRIISGTLGAVSAILGAFLLFEHLYLDSKTPLGIRLLFLSVLATTFLVSKAVLSGDKSLLNHPANKSNLEYFWLGAIIFCAAFLMFEVFEEDAQNRRESWTLSNYCTENGELHADRQEACTIILETFPGKMCLLGAEPMSKCEIRLRKALNK